MDHLLVLVAKVLPGRPERGRLDSESPKVPDKKESRESGVRGLETLLAGDENCENCAMENALFLRACSPLDHSDTEECPLRCRDLRGCKDSPVVGIGKAIVSVGKEELSEAKGGERGGGVDIKEFISALWATNMFGFQERREGLTSSAIIEL